MNEFKKKTPPHTQNVKIFSKRKKIFLRPSYMSSTKTHFRFKNTDMLKAKRFKK